MSDLSHIIEDLHPLATPLSAVHPDPSNARTGHDVDGIAASLAVYGQRTPIVANRSENGRIIKGNGTYAAARQLDWETIAVVWVEDDAMRATGYAIADNRLGDVSYFDNERLAQLLAAIDPDVAPTGFDDEALAAVLREAGMARPESDVDAEPQWDRAQELQEKWNVQPGDLWQLGDHLLLCGDCTDPAAVQRLMAGEQAVLFATDPPYLVDYDGTNHPHKWGEPDKNKDWSDSYRDWDSSEQGQELYDQFINVAIQHAIVDNAAWYCWHASRNQALLEGVWEKHGAFVHQQIVWVKDRPILTRSWYMWQHEPCFFGWIRGKKPPRTAEDYPPTVWTIPTIAPGQTTDHPTSKPVELFARPMRQHTAPGDVCYEPFCGSGSQIIAAERLGRLCRAMDIAPEYCAVTLERFLDATGQEPELIEGDGK